MEHSWPPRRSVIVPDDDSFLLGGSCATMADSRFEHSNIDRKGFNMLSRSTLLIAAVAALSVSTTAHAQSPRGTAEVTIAGKSVTIDYGRPSLRGRDMLGKAPAGTVWRTGADAATMFTTEADLTSGGKTIPAGSYTLFTKRVDDKTWHLVVNTQTGQWGTSHDASLDLTEVPLTWEQAGSSVEQFTIELADNGQMKMLWGTHVLKADFQAK